MRKGLEGGGRGREREKLYITSHYYWFLGDFQKTTEAFQLAVQEYPRDYTGHNNLGLHYLELGEPEKALGEEQEAIRIDPHQVFAYMNLARAYMQLNRIDESRAIVKQAFDRGLDAHRMHLVLFGIAFVQSSDPGMNPPVTWAR